MKIILNEEVVGLGEPGKIVDVAPGYARNYLVPRKLAVYANPTNVREMEHHKRRLDRKRQRLMDAARTVAEKLNGQVITMDVRAGQGGKLYGSVTTVDIAEAIKAQYDITVDRRKLHLREPIRTLGDHEVTVNFMSEANAVVKVSVTDSTQAPAPVAPPAAPVVEAAPVVDTTVETSEVTEA